MEPIPVKIKNVSVYPYLNVGPVGPVVEPIIKGAQGTYSVGTLTTWIYYNMELQNGEHLSPLTKGASYYALAENEDGTFFQTHWMHCLSIGDKPTFGLSENTLSGQTMLGSPISTQADESSYIVLGELANINGSILFPPPAIGQISVIENGKGQLIATRVGTPHLMGIRVQSGIVSALRLGEIVTDVSAKAIKSGNEVEYHNLQVVSLGEKPVLLQKWPY